MAKKWLKIAVPIFMVVVIGVIFLFQTNNKKSTQLDNGDFSLQVTSIDLDNLKSYSIPIILDFGADACIPCKQMQPVLTSVNKKMQDKAFIKFVDVWQHQEVAQDYPIQVIPTQVIFNADGTPYTPSDELSNSIEFTLYSTRDTNEHIFTIHQGGLTEEEMLLILKDMGVE